jgi:glycosyltransferase involved in cell wall biosynthesis
MQKILIITDAWEPQVNGVVRTYQNTIHELEKNGKVVDVIHPYCVGFTRVKFPAYPEIELVINPWKMKQKIWVSLYEGWKIHIATEGPLGIYARMLLRKKEFTTCYHTQFPEFIQKRTKIPASVFYPFYRWFHNNARSTMVPTQTMCDMLISKGFTKVDVWSRGVDTKVFNPSRRNKPSHYIVCVSRVSKEKGLDDFCKLKGKKVLVGDGPYLNELRKKFPEVDFVGTKVGVELAELVANADVFVFPSQTDTFGIVILEAIACGTPVASYEQPGPIEVINLMYNGMYSGNLAHNVEACKLINRAEVFESSKKWSWKQSTKQFLEIIGE